ncbi:hypothetical protein [Chryseobacterium oryctis]|uniref:Uncharacterized protein n=1 Tax=Chryseobacterium oryctis TaxID=2952618 RepID=A0ABT3HLG2_9FLAO|nr:hypothetical protein [Chryseobacterium oryctis]MCW3160620.1 hypothetical protein [Chryseobacterium oryctis]
MNKKEFYKIFIPAIEKAFKEDSINYGFYVKDPTEYLNKEELIEIEKYLENNEDKMISLKRLLIILMLNHIISHQFKI